MAIRAPLLALLTASLLTLPLFAATGCEKAEAPPTKAQQRAAARAEEERQEAAKAAAAIPGLVATLEDAEADPEAKLRAIQELRDLRAAEAAPAIRPYLEHELSPLRVAAAAALVALDDRPSHPAILEVAEGLSRDRDPQYVPMLFVVADLGTPEAVEYLRTVAEAHSAPAVREIAADALKEVER